MEILNFFSSEFLYEQHCGKQCGYRKKIDSRFDWTVVKFYSTPLFYIQDV